MNWEIGPIFRAVMRNKVGAVLIALQVAVTMTIIVNAIFIINERKELLARESGIDEANTFYLSSSGFGDNYNAQVTVEEDLASLRQIPGVINATQTNAIPISGGGWSMGLKTEPGVENEGVGVAVYFTDQHGLQTYDVELLAGRNFTDADITWRDPVKGDWPQMTILTQAMAKDLFPDLPYQDVVGKTVFINDDEPIQIIGIIDKLHAPWIGWDGLERVMLVPQHLLFDSYRYLIRTEPGQLDRLMPEIEALLADGNRNRIIRNMNSMTDTRERTYRGHSAMVSMLTIIIVVLTIVTALGIVGLVSFSVNRRRKQIGTRRALGATRFAVMRYFLVENFMITSVGVLLGAAMTVGLNIWLVNSFEMQRIDWYYIPIGMLCLWLIGLLAVYGPARKAASIPPALATRTV